MGSAAQRCHAGDRPGGSRRSFASVQRMEKQTVRCPYCGERLEIFIDRSVPRQEYIEDCQVCCRPIILTVTLDGDDHADAHVEARSEDA